MPSLPTGTVTFLFTDVEASTRLWEDHADAMRQALARHDALIEQLVEQQHGALVRPRGEGDSRFAVFARATDAVAAACAVQRAFLQEAWPTPDPLKVRMALHTGEADLREGDYYGTEVNRCARLRAVAHGGQTLLSEITAKLALDALPPGASLYDHGAHRLKDLHRPERIFELRHPDLPAEFPALLTLDRRPNNLPAQTTPFIGRERHVAEVRAMLQGEARVVTLTGPGGTGKTRLSLEVAADLLDSFADGVFFVPLASVSDPAMALPAVARALDVKESAGRSVADSLAEYLFDKTLLLVLDNFEQVVQAAPAVAGLVAACPGLKVLVSSREALRVAGEREYPVPPLGLPDPANLPPLERLTQYEAVRLFIERARAVRPDFTVTNENAPAVAEITHRLDGLPLAIELAAARVRLLTPRAMLLRFEHRLAFLTGGGRDLPGRQQTLRGAIAWSHDLLDPPERTLFRRLAVFAGGCTLEAAEAVCGDEDFPDVLEPLESLAAKSLIRQEERAGEPRFAMLETIREFAREQLDASGEAATLERRQATYVRDLVAAANRPLMAAGQEEWHARLDGEMANLRAALAWSLEPEGDPEVGLWIAAPPWRFWVARGYIREGREWLTRLLAQANREPSAAFGYTLGLQTAGILHFFSGDFTTARALLEEGRSRPESDLGGRWHGTFWNAFLGLVLGNQGELDTAAALIEEGVSVARRHGDPVSLTPALMLGGVIARMRGDSERALVILREALDHVRSLGDTWGTSQVLSNLGLTLYQQQDFAAARAYFEESLATRRRTGDRWGVAWSQVDLADAARAQGDYANARQLYADGLTCMRELGDRPGIVRILDGLTRLAAAEGQARLAAQLAGAAQQLRETAAIPLPPLVVRDDLARCLEPVRAALGAAAFDAAVAEGRTRPLEETLGLFASQAEGTTAPVG